MQGYLFLALVLIGSLFSLTAMRHLFLYPTGDTATTAFWMTLQIGPLLALLPGLMRGQTLSAFLAIVVSLLFFVHGVWMAVAAETRLFGIIEAMVATAAAVVAALLLRKLREQQGG